jgi:hypothetical protein
MALLQLHMMHPFRAVSLSPWFQWSVGACHDLDMVEVAGSIPVAPTTYFLFSQLFWNRTRTDREQILLRQSDSWLAVVRDTERHEAWRRRDHVQGFGAPEASQTPADVGEPLPRTGVSLSA